MMNLFTKHFAGQSIVSWVLQIILIWIAWAVKSHQIPNNLTTIFGAGVVLLLTYISFSLDRRGNRHKG